MDELVSELKPKERLKSVALSYGLDKACTEMSYEKAVNLVNKLTHREESDPGRLRKNTVCDHVHTFGMEMSECMDAMAAEVLETNGFSPETGLATGDVSQFSAPTLLAPPEVAEERREIIEKYNEAVKDDRLKIKDREKILAVEEPLPGDVVISDDGDLVPHQKESRAKGSKRDKKKIELQCAHIKFGGQCRVFVSSSLCKLQLQMLAFLIVSGVLTKSARILCITDGAKCLRAGFDKLLSFRRDKVFILDWYHLKKRVDELCSMAFKGKKEVKKEIKCLITGMLWVGNVEDAIKYVESFDSKKIANESKRQELLGYLRSRNDSIPCYALRKLVGAPYTSTDVEKTNDTLVSEREKGRGMSFSTKGSEALAYLKAAFVNGDYESWMYEKKLSWKTHPWHHSAEKAA